MSAPERDHAELLLRLAVHLGVLPAERATELWHLVLRGLTVRQVLQREQAATDAEIDALESMLTGLIQRNVTTRLPRLLSANATAAPGSPASATPTGIGPYTILEELGRGGMAVVYRARHDALQREVALKVIRPGLDADLGSMARFRLEAQAAAALGDHPGIVAARDVGEVDGRLFLVMDLVEGRPLEELLASGECTVRQIAEYLAAAARAVHYAHTRGILHRDVKPGNILVGADGHVRLTDFGLAKMSASEAELTALTRDGAVIGTPAYMSPEQATGRPLDARSDVYALGVTLWHACVGEPPFVGESMDRIVAQVASQPLPRPSLRNAEVPRDLETITLRACAHEPLQRYPTAAALADDLERFARGEPILARRPSAWALARRALRRNRRAVLAAAVTGAAAAALAGALLIPGWLRARDAEARQAAALAAEQTRRAQVEAARPFLEAARRVLARLEKLRMLPEWNDQQGKLLADSAARELRKALAACPDHADALHAMAQAALLRDDPDTAMEWCERAIASAPEFAPAYLMRALRTLREFESLRDQDAPADAATQGRLDELRARLDGDLRATVRHAADGAVRGYAAALLAFVAGDHPAAAPALEASATAATTDAEAWYWAGHAWSHVPGQEDQALQALTAAIRFQPRFSEALRVRANVRHRVGDHEGSLADRVRLGQTRGNSAGASISIGDAYMAKGDFEAARRCFDEAIALDPDAPRGYLRRVDAWLGAGRLAEARADVERALQLDPASPEAFGKRGLVRMQERDLDGAMADLDMAVQLAPANPRAHLTRGMLRHNRGDLAGALGDYAEAIRLDPQDPDAYYARGRTRLRMQDPRKAVDDFTAALERATGAWGFRGRAEEALARARAAAARQPR